MTTPTALRAAARLLAPALALSILVLAPAGLRAESPVPGEPGAFDPALAAALAPAPVIARAAPPALVPGSPPPRTLRVSAPAEAPVPAAAAPLPAVAPSVAPLPLAPAQPVALVEAPGVPR